MFMSEVSKVITNNRIDFSLIFLIICVQNVNQCKIKGCDLLFFCGQFFVFV